MEGIERAVAECPDDAETEAYASYKDSVLKDGGTPLDPKQWRLSKVDALLARVSAQEPRVMRAGASPARAGPYGR
eukprot:15450623-Alexandrium_andersonii.AAC.1